MHKGIDRPRLSPEDGPPSPEARRSVHAIGPSRVVQSPMGYSRGPLSMFALFSRFVPQMGDTDAKKVVQWTLTHPPVVFGPHRSPRGEGHTIFQGGSVSAAPGRQGTHRMADAPREPSASDAAPLVPPEAASSPVQHLDYLLIASVALGTSPASVSDVGASCVGFFSSRTGST